MKLPQKQTNTDPMEEAYKQLDGEPGMTAVSDAAKGMQPLNDMQQRQRDFKPQDMCDDIDHAYAQLFESLAVIIRNK